MSTPWSPVLLVIWIFSYPKHSKRFAQNSSNAVPSIWSTRDITPGFAAGFLSGGWCGGAFLLVGLAVFRAKCMNMMERIVSLVKKKIAAIRNALRLSMVLPPFFCNISQLLCVVYCFLVHCKIVFFASPVKNVTAKLN